MRRAGRLLIVAALGATIAVPILIGGKGALSATLNFPIQGYLALFATILASWLSRSMKLTLLMHRLGLRSGLAHALGIALATDFAFITTPGGVGGYAASVFYLRRAGASTGGAATITAADQGLDLLFLVLALPLAGIALLWSDLPQTVIALAFGTSALIVVLALTALLVRRKLAAWLFGTNALTVRWPGLLRKQQLVREFSASLRGNARLLLAGGPAFLFGLFATTALQWLTRYGILWLALALLGHRVAFALTLLLQVLVVHAALWTGVPAGGGGAEIGFSATFAPWVPAASLATALILWRMATLYIGLIAGALAIALLARRKKPQLAEIPIVRATPAEEGVN